MWATTSVVISMIALMFVHVLQSVLTCNNHQVMLQHSCSFIALNFLTLQCMSRSRPRALRVSSSRQRGVMSQVGKVVDFLFEELVLHQRSQMQRRML